MKLVDILARELRAWPKGFGKSVGQCHHGAIHSYVRPHLQSGQKFTRCDNYMADVVSKGEWQAAVDALRFEKVFDRPHHGILASTGEMASIYYVSEWTGEGLPPVGAVCESGTCHHMTLSGEMSTTPDTWERVTILAHGICADVGIAFAQGNNSVHIGRSTDFRPIRTPEQIAKEEIQKIRDEIKWQKPQLGPCPVEQMYLLGYRKFEIVDN